MLHFFPSNLYLHSDDIYFVNAVHSFVYVIMLNTLISKSYILLGAHTVLDKSLKVLQLSRHLSNLTKMDSSKVLDCNH